jgi:hypothetical protein
MATYTWSTLEPNGAAWTGANWVGGATANAYPQVGDVALIGDGTVDLSAPLLGVFVTLQPLPTYSVLNVTLAAANVEVGERSVLTAGSAAIPSQNIVYDVVGGGTLDAGSYFSFAQSPLTIELSAVSGQAPTFIDNGTMTGADLVVQNDTTTSAATLQNNSVIDVTKLLSVAAGVTLAGTGTIDLDGTADAVISGAVAAGQTISLAGGLASNQLVGTLTIDNIAYFKGAVQLDANHQIIVSGVTGSAAGNVVTFSNGDTLTVTPIGDASTVIAFSSGPLSAATTIEATGTVDNSGTVGSPGTTTACFLAGTRLATEGGDVAVEEVRAGDMLRRAGGGLACVRWVGHRAIRCDRHPDPRDVWPVRIRAGAFAGAVPARDLLLSPDHAVAAAGHLIPVRHLTNGATIVQERVAVARYHHVELPRHDLLLAEGLAAESYLDTGNRSAFEGGGPALMLHPDFSRRTWAARGCLKLVQEGRVLAAVRRALLRRAWRLGYRRTGDPGTSVLAGGRVLGVRRDGDRWAVDLPPGLPTVRLLSRVWVPADMRPGADDRRHLGIALGRLWLDRREVSLDSPALSSGWHAPERDGRWTDGDALLPVAGARLLTFTLTMVGQYWREVARAA